MQVSQIHVLINILQDIFMYLYNTVYIIHVKMIMKIKTHWKENIIINFTITM